MRICMVQSTPFPPEEGIGYYVYNLSQELIKRGHEVTVLTRGSLRKEILSYDGIKIIKIPFIPLYPFHVYIHGFFINKLIKQRTEDFDIIHTHFPLPPPINTPLPIITTIHGSMKGNVRGIELIGINPLFNRLLTQLVAIPLIKKHISSSSLITTVSDSVLKELQKYFGARDIFVIGYGVNSKIFSTFSGSKKEKYLLYVGRINYGKGLFDLIEMAKNICPKYKIPILLAGDGPLKQKLMKKAMRYNLEKYIKFLGHMKSDDLIHLYQNATIFIMPSFYESGPLVLLEAMSCGIPVISTKVGIAPEVIINGYNGFLIEPGSINDLINTTNFLLNNEISRERIGENARKTIENGYSWSAVANNMERCYNSIIRTN